jgi:Transposase DNA-binding
MDSWIEEETRSVNLGDPRLRRRLQRVLARFGAQPEGSVPLACPGSAEMHGAYREELRSLNQWRAVLPDTQLLYVADRESDIYELLA